MREYFHKLILAATMTMVMNEARVMVKVRRFSVSSQFARLQ